MEDATMTREHNMHGYVVTEYDDHRTVSNGRFVMRLPNLEAAQRWTEKAMADLSEKLTRH
jgi:hypothetical protein